MDEARGSAESATLASEVAALQQRVTALEREVAALRPQRSPLLEPAVLTVPVAPAVPAYIPSPPPPPVFAAVRNNPASLEDRLGSQVFNRVGVVALLIGTAWFLKLAIDNEWIGVTGRIVIGLLAGAGIIVGSEWLRRKGTAQAFAFSLKAVGNGVLYLSLWASFQLYHVLPADGAFVAMFAVTAWNAYMAWAQDAEVLAAYALLGGFMTPVLLSTGENHEIFLFSYLLLLSLASVLLLRFKPWPRIVLGALVFSVGFYWAWNLQWGSEHVIGVTALFLALFLGVFASIGAGPLRRTIAVDGVASTFEGTLTDVLLPLFNAAAWAWALFFLLDANQLHDWTPWLMVALAAVYLGLTQFGRAGVVRAVHLAIALIFLTIAIPLKAKGDVIVDSWLIEGVVLMWLASRLSTRISGSEGGPAVRRMLRALAALALALAYVGVIVETLVHSSWGGMYDRPFFSETFATQCLVLAGLAVVAWMTQSAEVPGEEERTWSGFSALATICFNLLALYTGVSELENFWRNGPPFAQSFSVSTFLMIYGAALLSAGFWRRSSFLRWQALILIIVTILKIFLYDTRNLSSGYRVLSFLGLGALLMGISFAYQRNWLGLRDAPDATSESDGL